VSSFHFNISVEEAGKTQLEPGQEHGGFTSVVTLFFAKKYLKKTDRYVAELW